MNWFKRNFKKIGIASIIAGISVVFAFAVTFYIEFDVSQKLYAEKSNQIQDRFLRIEGANKVVFENINKLEKSITQTTKVNVEQHNQIGQSISCLTTDIKSLTYIIIKNNKNMEKDLESLKKANNLMTYRNDTISFNHKPSKALSENRQISIQDVIYKNNKNLEIDLKFFLRQNNNIMAKK